MNLIKHSATARVTTSLANCPKGFGGQTEKSFWPPLFLRNARVSPAQRNCARSFVVDDTAIGCERAPETGAETGSSTAKTPIFFARSFSSFPRFLLFL